MRQDRDVERLTVQSRGLNVEVGRGVLRRGYDEPLAARQVEREFAKQRAADHVIPRHGVERIEPHGREDVPRRHLAAVLVSQYAGGSILVRGGGDLAHSLIRPPRLAAGILEGTLDVAWVRFLPGLGAP